MQPAPPTDAGSHLDAQRRRGAMSSATDPGEGCLSLEDILRLYSQPINEEQAWAVCYQCCRTLAREQRGRRRSSAAATGASSAALPRRISGPGDVRIQKDGSVRVDHQGSEGKGLFEKDSSQACMHGGHFQSWSMRCCCGPQRIAKGLQGPHALQRDLCM